MFLNLEIGKLFTLKFDIREAIMESMDLYFKFLPDK